MRKGSVKLKNTHIASVQFLIGPNKYTYLKSILARWSPQSDKQQNIWKQYKPNRQSKK